MTRLNELRETWAHETQEVLKLFYSVDILEIMADHKNFMFYTMCTEWIRNERLGTSEWTKECYEDRLKWLAEMKAILQKKKGDS